MVGEILIGFAEIKDFKFSICASIMNGFHLCSLLEAVNELF